MLPSDIWTPLYGFVFHMEGSLLVPPTIRPIEANLVHIGEWGSLQVSNFLLSQRFGPLYRANTSSAGEGEARDIQVSFFMAHYVVEKLRETQLESYWIHWLDQNINVALS
ncbi:hypothetical protein BGZ59_007209 [Podila verticillata]|nr:hypothetical protein BGZ59_007209 [Podila verticillata]KFH72853.1 hypothetical protein MVEG_00078 [Podila verticillata NRRL 6337]